MEDCEKNYDKQNIFYSNIENSDGRKSIEDILSKKLNLDNDFFTLLEDKSLNPIYLWSNLSIRLLTSHHQVELNSIFYLYDQ
jgi:hypothetical protein